MTKLRTGIYILLIVTVCVLDGLDRYHINSQLEKMTMRAELAELQRDMAIYRLRHPFK